MRLVWRMAHMGQGRGELHKLVSVGKGDRGSYVKGYY